MDSKRLISASRANSCDRIINSTLKLVTKCVVVKKSQTIRPSWWTGRSMPSQCLALIRSQPSSRETMPRQWHLRKKRRPSLAPAASIANVRSTQHLHTEICRLSPLFARDIGESPGSFVEKPGFVPDSVGLAMENVTMHVDTIPIVQQILLLDIPTKKFRLPSQKRKKPGDLVAWRGVWSEFVRTLCGIPDLEKAYRTASIQTIRIALDCDTSDLTLLCSALAEAKVVQHVMLYKHQVEGSDFGIYDELSVGGLADALEERVLSKEICRWLSFALLSKATTPSVEILSLNGYTLGASEASATTEVVSSTDPMDAMLHGFGQCRSKDPTQREVLRLPAGIWRNERGQVKKRRVHTWIRVLSC